MESATKVSRLEEAWEKAKRLSEFRQMELADFIEFLAAREEQDDTWEPDEEEKKAIERWFAGDRSDCIPWEQVKRESRELGDRVLD